MAVPKVRTEVELDEDVLRRAQAAAERTGRNRDDVIEDAVRRHLSAAGDDPGPVDPGALDLDGVLARVRPRSQLTDDEALRLAVDEQAAYRAGRVDHRAPDPPAP